MTKQELWGKAWIHIKRARPPETHDEVILYNPLFKRTYIIEAYVAKHMGDAILEEGMEAVSRDRFFTHWMFVIHPISKKEDDGKANNKKEPKRKRRVVTKRKQ